MKQIRINHWILAPSANILVGGLGLITSIVIARNLGPNLRGVFAEAILWPTLVLTLGSLVNTQSMVYFWSKGKKDSTTDRVFGSSILWSVLLSLILVPVSWGLNYLVLGSNGKLSFLPANIYSFIIPILLLSYSLSPIFLAENRMVIYWSLRLTGSFIYLTGILVLAYINNFTIIYVIVLLLTSQFIPLLLSTILVRLNFQIKPVWHLRTFLSLAKYGYKVNLTGLPYQLNLKVDQALISIFLPIRDLGYYTVAFSWSSSLSFLGVGLSVVMLVRSSAANIDDREALKIMFRQLRTAFIALIIIGSFFAVSTPILLPILFGYEYIPSIIPGVILCIAGIMLSLNIILHELIRGLGDPGLGIRAEIFGLISSLILLFVLLPIIGIVGAAIASTLSYSIVTLTLLLLLSRKTNFQPKEIIIPRKSDFQYLVGMILATIHSYRIRILP